MPTASTTVGTPRGLLDLASPADALLALRKVHGSTRDGQAVIYHWSGRAWSRVEGEPDRLLFRVEGMNVRQCGSLLDAQRGSGFRLVSRELMLYLDPLTGEPLRQWRNPWTGHEVEVRHVANDPVNLPPFFERDLQGRPTPPAFRVQGERVFLNCEIPLLYPNPLGRGEADAPHYQAMEIFDFSADRARLLDPASETADACICWVRIAPWLPFMDMGRRPGLMLFNASGQSMARIEDLPAVLQRAIADEYPAYVAPPALDDTRANVTSWTAERDRRAALG